MSETLTVQPPEEQALDQMAIDRQEQAFEGMSIQAVLGHIIDNEVANVPHSIKSLNLAYSKGRYIDTDGNEHMSVGGAYSNDRKLKSKEDSMWTEEAYDTIRTISQMTESDEVQECLESGRVALALSAASRVYRLQHTTGLYTSYDVGNKFESQARQKEAARIQPNVLHLKTTKREPIPISGADVQRLMAEGTKEEKIAAVAEMLNPHRFRTDPDAPKEHVEQKKIEEDLAFDLLSSLEPSPDRDMLAVEAIKLYVHKNSKRADLLSPTLDLIQVPELRTVMERALELAGENEPSDVVERARITSKEALSKVQKGLSPEDMHRQHDTGEQHKDEARITINIGVDALCNVLFESNKVLPVYEVRSSGGNDHEDGEFKRRLGEHELELHDYDEALLERPVYGALALSEEEKLLGAHGAQSYGNIVINLKPEVTTERATFTFGDSMNLRGLYDHETADEQSARKMVAEDAVVAKVAFDENPPEPEGTTGLTHRYVEAQVHGGVGPEDIESITVPLNTLYATPGLLRKIVDEYPSIDIKVLMSSAERDSMKESTKQAFDDNGVEVVMLSAETESQRPAERRPLKHNEEA